MRASRSVVAALALWCFALSLQSNVPVSSISQEPAISRQAAATTCELQPIKRAWAGSCALFFGQRPRLTIEQAKSIKSGIWRKDTHPVAVWAGEMTDLLYPGPVEIELYSHRSGVLRSQYGWFAVSQFALKDSTLRFEMDTAREVTPSELDREIIKKAAETLSSDFVWNRADNRNCPLTATTWSIYCAMERATIEVTGGFHHRRPALEVVRQIVDERSAGRNYHHRLMDYNNDASTRLSDVQSLFAEALRWNGTLISSGTKLKPQKRSTK